MSSQFSDGGYMSASMKQMVQHHRRSLKAMQKKVMEMSDFWIDEDECNRAFLEELSQKIEQTAKDLAVE
ncbi:hypothetical protein VCX83_06835 [Aeromonas caviae]|uniref:hypothetical protein n=2 Tax=Aeromonas TaxID=642 RepID=UPI002B247079|nr:hypothetical protein [Aeromonas caviae]MEA9421631.1 hypothetical protein [Aeromonas caviae]